MKLEDTRAAYETLSGKASDIVRQLSLAGIALVWLFRSETGAGATPRLDPTLLKAAFFIFVALTCDFLQYLSGTIIWFIYFRYKELKGTKEGAEFGAPPALNWPTWLLFYLKSAMMLAAYAVYIIPFLFSKFVG